MTYDRGRPEMQLSKVAVEDDGRDKVGGGAMVATDRRAMFRFMHRTKSGA